MSGYDDTHRSEAIRQATLARDNTYVEHQKLIASHDALRTIAAQLAEALGKRQWVGVGACDCGGIKGGIPHRTGCDVGGALEAWEKYRDH